MESGNLSYDIPRKDDKAVHFCHGAPGAIPLFIAAYEYFGDEQFLSTAKDFGEVTWHRGILIKGPGLCHGITGNAYFLHSLYRATGDEIWLRRT